MLQSVHQQLLHCNQDGVPAWPLGGSSYTSVRSCSASSALSCLLCVYQPNCLCPLSKFLVHWLDLLWNPETPPNVFSSLPGLQITRMSSQSSTLCVSSLYITRSRLFTLLLFYSGIEAPLGRLGLRSPRTSQAPPFYLCESGRGYLWGPSLR